MNDLGQGIMLLVFSILNAFGGILQAESIIGKFALFVSGFCAAAALVAFIRYFK